MRLVRSHSSLATVFAVVFVVGACDLGCATGSDSSGGGGDETGVSDDGGVDGTSDGTSIEGGDSSVLPEGGDDGGVDGTTTDGDGGSADGADGDESGSETSDGASTDSGDTAPLSDGGDSATGVDSGTVVDSGLDSGSVADGDLDSGTVVDSGTIVDTAPIDTGVDTAPVDTGVDTGPPACGTGACTVDTDKDGIPDSVEGSCLTPATDTDGDGTADYLDLDSDNDTIPDKVEWAGGGCDPTALLNDVNGDGIPNFRDLDSDGNGLPDKFEACPPASIAPTCTPATPADTDGDGVADWLDSENDHDSPSPDPTIGLEDRFELVDNAGAYVGPKVFVPYKTYDTSRSLIDTDSDGVPDVWDRDSDSDNIFDLQDGLGDPNKNGAPNFRDGDSDGDGVPDVCEARANPVYTPSYVEAAKGLRDTNGDGIFDYLQRDTDGDLLLDGTGPLGSGATGEDKNGNCIVDSNETDRLKPDTDGDGVTDFIEVTVVDVACAKDPTCTPASKGKFFFIEPYSPDGSAKPTPTSSPLGLRTDLQKGDLAFVVDTTYSMNGEFTNLKTSLGTIIDSLKTRLPDLGIGIAGHDDFPESTAASNFNYGVCDNSPYSCDPTLCPGGKLPVTDVPYYQLTAVTTDKPTATTAVGGLRMSNGGDLPEDQVAAMFYAFTGSAESWPRNSACPGGNLGAVAETATNFGAIGFRKGALPMLMEISDAEFHNGVHPSQTMPTTSGASSTWWFTYDPASTTGNYYTDGVLPYSNASAGATGGTSFVVPTISDLATAMKAKGARFLGGAADDGRGVRSPAGVISKSGPASPVAGGLASRNASYDYGAYGDMAYLADQTGSLVPPTAFAHGAACPVGQCCTGFNGAGVAPDGPGGTCRLVFNVNHNGTGLGTEVVDAVVALLNAITFDVHVQAAPTTGEAYDAVDNFMTAIQPSPSGGVDPSIGTCITFTNLLADRYHTPKALAGGGDIQETILGVSPGPLICFSVIPKANVTVVPTSTAQIFHASLQVIAENGSGTIPLGTARTVLFVVPPIVN